MKTNRAFVIFLHIVFILLIVWLAKSITNKSIEPTGETKMVRDTIVQTKIDTLICYKPIYKYMKVVDTIYINDTIAIQVEQKYYSKQNAYDLWISGYNANLDSIKTYNQTVKEFITTTTTEIVYKRSWDFYPYLGIRYFGDNVKPTIGMLVKSPERWVIGGEFGITAANNAYYGFNIGYKIGK